MPPSADYVEPPYSEAKCCWQDTLSQWFERMAVNLAMLSLRSVPSHWKQIATRYVLVYDLPEWPYRNYQMSRSPRLWML